MEQLRIVLSLSGLAGRPKQILDWATATGFRELEVPLEGQPFGLLDLDDSGLRDLGYQLASRSISVSVARRETPVVLNHPSLAEQAMEVLKKTLIRLAPRLRVLLVLPVGLADETRGGSEEVLQEALERMREILEHFEYHLALAGKAELLNRLVVLLRQNPTPFWGVAFDIGEFVELEANIPVWLQDWHDVVKLIYATDGRFQDGVFRQVTLGEGAVQWQEVLEVLREEDISVPMVLRPVPAADPYREAAKAMQFLRRLA